jgi:DNA-binding NarL/FixJ family response regulator
MISTVNKLYKLRKEIDNKSLEYHLLQDKHIAELERKEKIIALKNNGWTYRKIAWKFNLCISTVCKIYNTPETSGEFI